MNKIRLTFIDSDNSLIDKIEEVFISKAQLGISIVGRYSTKSEFFANKKIALQTDVFVVSANLPDGTGIEIVEFLQGNESLRAKPIFMMIDAQTLNYARIGEEKGVHEIFQKPFKMVDFVKAIMKHTNSDAPVINGQTKEEKKVEVKQERKSRRIFDEIDSSQDLNVKKNEVKSRKKGVFTFISTSSSGKTSLIINLANVLRKLEKEKPTVCILDLNLVFPAAFYMFDQEHLTKPKRDIYDITKDLAYLNEELIMEAMIVDQESGIHLLSAPRNSESLHKTSLIKAEQIEKLIVLLREMFDIVLIDTPNRPTENIVLTPIQFSDKTILLLEPNFVNIVGASKLFYILETLEKNIKEKVKDKVFIVLNRDKKGNSLNNDTTRTFLEGKKIIVKIPEDPNFMSMINKGTLISETNSSLVEPLKKLSQFLFDHEEEIAKKKNKPKSSGPITDLLMKLRKK